MITELCTCCGHGGRGFLQAFPQVWAGCQCLGVRRCGDCSGCYEHCLCTPAEQRLEALDREGAALRESVAEARHLAAALGVDEVHGTLNDDTICQIEQLLRARYRAFRRLRRRIDRLFAIDHADAGPSTDSGAPRARGSFPGLRTEGDAGGSTCLSGQKFRFPPPPLKVGRKRH